jgi:hypothetical protein
MTIIKMIGVIVALLTLSNRLEWAQGIEVPQRAEKG